MQSRFKRKRVKTMKRDLLYITTIDNNVMILYFINNTNNTTPNKITFITFYS